MSGNDFDWVGMDVCVVSLPVLPAPSKHELNQT